MSIGPRDVAHIARLAEIQVDPAELDTLVTQLNRIVDYVAQLDEVPVADQVAAFQAGPDAVRLRPDEVRPTPLRRPPSAMAPDFRDGFFVVPRLDSMGGG